MQALSMIKNTLQLIYHDKIIQAKHRVTFIELYGLLTLKLDEILKISNEMYNDKDFTIKVRREYKNIELFVEQHNIN